MQNDDWIHGSLYGKGWANGYAPDPYKDRVERVVYNMGTTYRGHILRHPWDLRVFLRNANYILFHPWPLKWKLEDFS